MINMVYNEEEIRSKVDRLAEIKKQVELLKTEQSSLEGDFLKMCTDDLQDTKNKTIAYTGTAANKVTATMAQSLKAVYPSYFERIFGMAYEDAVTEDKKYKLSTAASRMLTGLWTKSFTRITIAEIIEKLPCDAKAKNALTKKLKGINYDTDKKNLKIIGGFDETTAGDYAYFVSEAAVWESFLQLMKINKMNNPSDIKNILDIIDGAVVVEETPKISVEMSA